MKLSMKQNCKTAWIVPRCATQAVNAAAEPAGNGDRALNVRECEGGLVAVGVPAAVGAIPAGHRLLAVDADRMLTLSGLDICFGGTVVATLPAAPVGVHEVGGLWVVTTRQGLVWLRRTAQGYDSIDPATALPGITLSALEQTSLQTAMGACAFAAPYTAWHSPLATADVAALTRMMRTAWTTLQHEADAAGQYAAPMLARYGVRLHDDTYLWLSEPVELGAYIASGISPVTTLCETSGTSVTGIPATSLSRPAYRLGITVARGVAAAWRALVKSVDILVSPQAQVVNTSADIDYACLTTSQGRLPSLQMSLPLLGDAAVAAQLAHPSWTVVASTDDFDSLAAGRWVSPATQPTSEVVVPGVQSSVVAYALGDLTLTDAEASMAGALLSSGGRVASMVAAGRLLTVGVDGLLTVGVPGNALAVERCETLSGLTVTAMTALSRPVYSNGFGRYPVVLFASDGIFALPQAAAGGAYGEPRLLDRTVADASVAPVEGDRDVWFVSDRGHLCRLHGGELRVMARGLSPRELAWDSEHRELWMRLADGSLLALLSDSGRMSERLSPRSQLFGDARRAVAVDADGTVCDLTDERAAEQVAVAWRSHPFCPPAPLPHAVLWQVVADRLDVVFELRGETGRSCHGFLINRLHAEGRVGAPLGARVMSRRVATLRLQLEGTMPSGTVIPAVAVTSRQEKG